MINQHGGILALRRYEMVTKKDLEDGLAKLEAELKETFISSIETLKSQIIDNLVEANKLLQGRVKSLEEKVNKLEIDFQESLQYNRQNNLIISGIPKEVEHKDVLKVSLGIVNTCLNEPVGPRDVQGCHRLSPTSGNVVCRLVNKAVVEEVLGNSKRLQEIDKKAVGLPTNTGSLFVSVHLTPYMAKLAYHCRQLKRNNKIVKMSTKKGKIKINIEEGTWETISHVRDLQRLFPDSVFL